MCDHLKRRKIETKQQIAGRNSFKTLKGNFGTLGNRTRTQERRADNIRWSNAGRLRANAS